MNSKIAVIDDEIDICNQLKLILSKQNYEVETWESGSDFLDYVKNNSLEGYSLIITDIMMPEISGTEMIEELCKINALKNIPVLFLSILGEDVEIVKAHESAADTLSVDYLTKPFQIGWLIKKVDNLVKLHDYYNELVTTREDLSMINIELEQLLDESKSINDYLTERLKKIIVKQNSSITKQLKTVRSLMPNIANNDLGLLKFVLDVIDNSQNVIKEMVLGATSEEEELFKILPKTIEPLMTAIADIEQVFNIFITMGIISKEDLINVNIENTSFYEILYKMYSNGYFSQQLFEKFLEDARFKFGDESDDSVQLF